MYRIVLEDYVPNDNDYIKALIDEYLGIESSFWLRMKTDYNIQTTKHNKTYAKRLESIRKIAAVL